MFLVCYVDNGSSSFLNCYAAAPLCDYTIFYLFISLKMGTEIVSWVYKVSVHVD